MCMSIDPEKFQESITRELEVVKDRVRNLIGSAHWGEEGRFKEAVLTNVIRRFLPSNLSVGTGFMVKSVDGHTRGSRVEVSKQIDIIVYDNRIPVLFSEGDFIITTDLNVRAIIEVKTRTNNSELRNILRTSIENGKMIEDGIFNGVFVYEYDNGNLIEGLKSVLEESREDGRYVNHISLGPYIFIRHWMSGASVDSDGCDSDFFGVYDFGKHEGRQAKKLSFSYFISNLIYSISEERLSDRLWLLFPVKEGKEAYRIGTACLGRS